MPAACPWDWKLKSPPSVEAVRSETVPADVPEGPALEVVVTSALASFASPVPWTLTPEPVVDVP